MGARRERRGRTCVNTDVAHPCRECNSERDSVNIDIAPLCAARAGGAATSSAKALPSEPLRRTSRSATSEQHPALINFFFGPPRARHLFHGLDLYCQWHMAPLLPVAQCHVRVVVIVAIVAPIRLLMEAKERERDREEREVLCRCLRVLVPKRRRVAGAGAETLTYMRAEPLT